MSKNIVIQEGGVGRQLTADKLKTNLVSGGTCLWVPEDDVQLTTKTVTKNGTYKASKDGYYGYDKVIVNVAGGGSISGKGADGNEYSISVDENGNIVETKLPSEIRIITPPTYTGPYGDGAYIGFDGLVVTAYDGDGNVWTGDGAYPDGVIPTSELVFPVTVARHSEGGIGWVADPSWIVSEAGAYLGYSNDRAFYKTNNGNAIAFFKCGDAATWWAGPILVSTNYESSLYSVDGEPVPYDVREFQYGGLMWYFSSGYHFKTNNYGTPLTHVLPSDNDNDEEMFNTVMTMANVIVTGVGEETIPVQWIRPDGNTLEDNFVINVIPGGGQGGSESGGGSTVDDGHGGGGGSF